VLDLPDLRARFRIEVARYAKLAAFVEADLKTGLKEAGVYAEVTGRAKEEPNFIRKALKKHAADPDKHADPLASITDRAGARAVVLHHEGAERACSFVRDRFEVVEFEDARDRLQSNELGYLGLHFLVRIYPEPLSSGELDLVGLICEVQIHTKAQSAWASVSHPMLYKPVGGAVSPLIAHRVNRAVALIDLFDEEIMRARGDLMNESGYQPAAMLRVLEAEYLRVAPKDFDAELSLQVLAGLVAAYSANDLNHYKALIEQEL
jgi:ppGpp synthetase/RelA/SpoT-type nucleotidyltranferase